MQEHRQGQRALGSIIGLYALLIAVLFGVIFLEAGIILILLGELTV